MLQKASRLLAATALTAATLAVPVSQPALAAPTDAGVNRAGTLATCYGGAVREYFQRGGWGGEIGPYRTSSRCRDINLRNDSQYAAYFCVVFIDKTNNCNYWTYIPAKSGWFTIATNVKDGVDFKVRVENSFYRYDPLITYTAY